MKTIDSRSPESGQILVILTVGIVALIGMLALAVDGGLIYADRRFDQNAADASSFAGGGAAAIQLENNNIFYNDFNCTDAFNIDGTTNESHDLYPAIFAAKEEAINRARSNYFEIVYPLQNQHGVEITCTSPPATAPRYLSVRTVISSTVNTAFAHLFYKGEVRNTVEAVVTVRPPFDVGFGYALANLNTDCKKGLTFQGDAEIKLSGGGAHSNAGITRGGNTITTIQSPGKATYTSEDCGYKNAGGGSGKDNKNKEFGSITPDPINDENLFIKKVYLEDMGGYGECPALYVNPDPKTPKSQLHSVTNGGTISPATYEKIQVNASEVLIMEPGFYCIQKDFNGVGGEIIADGVTIIMLGGSVDIGGNVKVRMTATSDPEGQIFGLLFYAAKGNDNSHKLVGTGESYFEGLLWFPDGHITLSGTGSEITPKYSTQVVADQITVSGNNYLNMIYDKSRLFRFSSRVYLDK
jgi:hypothetical protein